MTRLSIDCYDNDDGEFVTQTIRDTKNKGEVVAQIETEIAVGVAGHEYLKITVRRIDESRVGPVVMEVV